MNTFYIKTFGCKVNQYDSRRLGEHLCRRGYHIESPHKAENIIINGCSVTSRSEQKIRSYIRRCQRQNPGATIIVTGCYARRLLLSGTSRIEGIVVVPRENETTWEELFPFREHTGKEYSPPFSSRTRAFIKIQDGCEHYCSYCIVPYVRGSSRSRHPDEIFTELKRVKEQGYREIVFTGIHIGQYGKGLSTRTTLTDLLRETQDRFDFERIRLSSIEWNEVTPDLIELLQSPAFCRHLHIPLQSGSNTILHKMNRSYTREDFLHTLHQLRQKIPLIGISTDIIAGFPGETPEDFEQTRQIFEEFDFVRAHIFPYSPRPFTRAASMEKYPSPSEIKRRAAVLRKESTRSVYRFYARMRHKTFSMLTETHHHGYVRGYSDNYLNIVVPASQPVKSNLICRVKGLEVQQKEKEIILLSQREDSPDSLPSYCRKSSAPGSTS